MATDGILSSSYQRRVIAILSITAILVLLLFATMVNFFTPATRGWDLVSDILVALATSAMFALLSAAFLHFFSDPSELEASTRVLPGDIGEALDSLARTAADYILYVRTGRHFRAVVLPVLLEKAKADRKRINVEVVLLDFRDAEVCQRYASYRGWSLDSVRTEIIATILSIVDSSNAATFVTIDLYLSSRLSTFRFDGTPDEIIITRENEHDHAWRYKRSDPHFAAFTNEFNWVKEGAHQIKKVASTTKLPSSLHEIFGQLDVIDAHLPMARKAMSGRSPYAK